MMGDVRVWRIVLGYALISFIVCAAYLNRPYTIYEFSEGWLNSSQHCASRTGMRQSPEAYDRAHFLKRFDDGYITGPINLRCILSNYSEQDIAYWASRSDPVAQLTQIFLMARQDRNICKRAGTYVPILRNLMQQKYSEDQPRIPEAYLILHELYPKCYKRPNPYYDILTIQAYRPITPYH